VLGTCLAPFTKDIQKRRFLKTHALRKTYLAIRIGRIVGNFKGIFEIYRFRMKFLKEEKKIYHESREQDERTRLRTKSSCRSCGCGLKSGGYYFI
jgi:hypothetical protein